MSKDLVRRFVGVRGQYSLQRVAQRSPERGADGAASDRGRHTGAPGGFACMACVQSDRGIQERWLGSLGRALRLRLVDLLRRARRLQPHGPQSDVLYACHADLPMLRWGRAKSDFVVFENGFHSAEERAAANTRIIKTAASQRLSRRQRAATPVPLRSATCSTSRYRPNQEGLQCETLSRRISARPINVRRKT